MPKQAQTGQPGKESEAPCPAAGYKDLPCLSGCELQEIARERFRLPRGPVTRGQMDQVYMPNGPKCRRNAERTAQK